MRCSTSKRRARPPMPYAFSDGDTARHIVLEVRLLSATTRLVDRGLSPLSTHSTLAKNDFRSMAIYVCVVVCCRGSFARSSGHAEGTGRLPLPFSSCKITKQTTIGRLINNYYVPLSQECQTPMDSCLHAPSRLPSAARFYPPGPTGRCGLKVLSLQ